MSKIILLIIFTFLNKPLSASNFLDFFVNNIKNLTKLLIEIDDKYEIMNEAYIDCYLEAFKIIKGGQYYKLKYPKIFAFNGKAIDDLGNEIECENTGLHTKYIFFHFKTSSPIIIDDNGLSEYLDRKYLSFGFCIPSYCLNLAKNIAEKMNNITKIEIFTKFQNLDVNIYSYEDVENSHLFGIILSISFGLFFLKFILWFISNFKYPKGYEYHGANLYHKNLELLRSINEGNEEKENDILIKNKVDVKNIGGEYNPDEDLEPYYPFGLRILKFFDLFDNIKIISFTKNRYYNEKMIKILSSMKALVLVFVLLFETIFSIIKLPNPSVFDQSFYKTYGLSFYKMSINSLYFWVILESSTFSFKLMKFIKKKLNNTNENISIKRVQINIVIKQIFKFLFFYIPKIIIFISIYFLFYYFFSYYTSSFNPKMAHHYIYEKIIKPRECLNNISYAFFPFYNYNYSLPNEYLKVCFPFTYIYSNMFYSSLIFMIILIILFYFQTVILDVVFTIGIFLNLLISYIYLLLKKQNENNETNYSFYHFSGENYSIFYPHIFFSLYYFGCLLGFCFCYYTEKDNLRESLNMNLNISSIANNPFSLENSLIKKKKSKDLIENNESKEQESLYQPMNFCSTFIQKLKKVNIIIKYILLILYFIIFISLSIIPIFLFNMQCEENFTFKLKGNYALFLFYFFEKLINVFLFIFFICLILVFPKKHKISKFFNSSIFNPISRSGFFFICSYQSFLFIFYCLFQLKIKISFYIIINIIIGLYAIIGFSSFIFTILAEMPFRIIIKNLLKDDKQRYTESSYRMKQIQDD